MYKIVKTRVAAKLIADVEIPEEVWKPDFDIVDRYQSFANELMRIDLLAIGGFGFLIKDIVLEKSSKLTFTCISMMIIALVCIILSLAAVLCHRFLSTSCLFYQVIIMRSLKRTENPHWSEDEINTEKIFLAKARKNQTLVSTLSRQILMTAVVTFIMSLILVMIVFYKAILPVVS
jgi:hypothetical protein